MANTVYHNLTACCLVGIFFFFPSWPLWQLLLSLDKSTKKGNVPTSACVHGSPRSLTDLTCSICLTVSTPRPMYYMTRPKLRPICYTNWRPNQLQHVRRRGKIENPTNSRGLDTKIHRTPHASLPIRHQRREPPRLRLRLPPAALVPSPRRNPNPRIVDRPRERRGRGTRGNRA